MANLQSAIACTTKKGNHYLYDKNTQTLSYSHPIFHHLLEMEKRGEDPAVWVGSLSTQTIDLDGIGPVMPEEIRYYFKKFMMFKDNGCLGEIEMKSRQNLTLIPEYVESIMANLGHLIFEVTSRCNLNCEYCGYGRFYCDFANRGQSDMDPALAERALDYFLSRIESSLRDSRGYPLTIGFYGGEPLLNFPLIRHIVEYVDRVKIPGTPIKFNMTTNGILLDKHFDFFVEHDFNLLISLDGDEASNSYRVFHNGESSFAKVFSNTKQFLARYPEYFKKRVFINSVLHDRNTLSAISSFIKKEFGAYPFFSPLSPLGIRAEARDEFKAIYSHVLQDMKNCSNAQVLSPQVLYKLPDIEGLKQFISSQNSTSFIDLNHLLSDENEKEFSTSTCFPMQKKAFITVDGRIYPCEQVGDYPILGRVSPEQMAIDPHEIAELFNDWTEKIKQTCITCYRIGECPVCMYQINGFPQPKACQWQLGYEGLMSTVTHHLNTLENRPHLYHDLMNEV